MKGSGGAAAAAGGMPMQSAGQQHDPNFSSQHTYIPPDQAGGMPPPGPYPNQPYAPPPGGKLQEFL